MGLLDLLKSLFAQPLESKPWRQFQKNGNDHEQSIKDSIKKLYSPIPPSILFVGPINAGKSSFINSCLSVCAKRKKALAWTGGACEGVSCTLKFMKYNDNELLKDYRLMDCMGIDPGVEDGIHLHDLDLLLNGHVKVSYKFDPKKQLTSDSEFYEPNPKFEDNIHCVVFVVEARVMNDGIPSQYVDKIKCVQNKVKEADVQRVLILTKVDKLCEKVRENTSNIFRSKAVLNAVKVASEVFSIAMASIHPVVNYEDTFELTTEQNIPIWLALCQILQYANDRVEYANPKN